MSTMFREAERGVQGFWFLRRALMKSFEIMFDDLNEGAQKRFLEFQGLNDPEDGNFETMPIAIVDLEENDGEGEGEWQ